MKKILTTLFAMAFSIALLAQPTVTSNIALSVGDSGPVQPFNQITFDAGPSGANVTWDFSGVTPAGMEFNWTAEDPANTPWGNDFPTADMAFDYPLDSIRDVRYYRFDGTKLELLGVIQEISGSSQDTFRYDFNTNPTLEMQFPMTYEDQVMNTSSGTAKISFMGMGFEVDRTIDRTITADGYGTLMTPLGTFQNVLRVRIEENIEDKTFGQSVGTQENARYFWYLPNEKYLLLQMDSIVVKNAGGSFPTTSMFYRSGAVMTGLDKNIAQAIEMKVYPNPATTSATLSYSLETPGEVEIELLTQSGQLIHTVAYSQEGAGSHQQKLDTTPLATGLYFVRIKTSLGVGIQMLAITR